MAHLRIGDLEIDVELKDVKNVHLSVYPPTGAVRIAAPAHMGLETIRVYALSKLGWIRQQQQKFREQLRESPREYLYKEGHYYLGKRYQLRIQECDAPARVTMGHHVLELQVRPNTPADKREAVLDQWYRQQLRQEVAPLFAKWEKEMGVSVQEIGIKKMKTKWGTCNPEAGRIWLNLELAKKPLACIEYIVVHELVHLKEATHNAAFVAWMDHYLPNWRHLRQQLNSLPVPHADWKY